MTAMLLNAMFACFGLTALASMALTFARYGRRFVALREELRNCGELRNARIRVAEVQVRTMGIVLTPDFTPEARRPAAQRGLRAAA